MPSKVRFGGVLAIALMFAGPAAMRADTTVFSSFGPGQSYETNSYVDVGAGSLGNQVVAFPFVPSQTVFLQTVDIAAANVGPSFMPLMWFNNNGEPGNNTTGGFNTSGGMIELGPSSTPGVVTFTCNMSPYGDCPILQAGVTYWLVVQQLNDAPALSEIFFSPIDTATWFYDETGNAAGPWTTATLTDSIGAFDVNGIVQPTPEPGSFVLLGSGMVAAWLGHRRWRFVSPGKRLDRSV